MKRSTKLLLGAATVWPVAYLFLFFAFVFGMVIFSAGVPMDDVYAPVLGVGFMAIFVLHFLTIFLSFGLTIFYIVHVIKDETLDTNMKAMWAVLLFMAGMIVQPIYWYLKIWKESPVENSPAMLSSPTWSAFDNRVGRDEYTPAEPPDWR